MILSYGGKNCWAFKDWMEINFQVSKSAPKDISFTNKKIVSAICFEGPNAAGKSCALRVLSFIADFCRNSFNYPTENLIMFDSFYNNNNTAQFFIRFTVPKDLSDEYKYEVTLSTDRIHSEKLTRKNDKGTTILFRRTNNKTVTDEITDGSVRIIYKPTASFISTMIQYGIKEIEPIKEFFSRIYSNVSYSQTLDDPLSDYAAQFYYDNPKIHKKVIEHLKKWDTGIKSVEIIPANDNQGRKIFMSVFHHNTETESDALPFQSQSTGTKLLYNKLRDFIITIEQGGVLVFDELDNHLHSNIIPVLIGMFLDKEINKKNAQIVFTSHNTMLLDELKKYRVYLFKKINGESICYRIDELPGNNLHRNDRSLEQMYKSGLLGGQPDVEDE